MAIGWIDTIYNNSSSPYYLKSADDRNNGELRGDDGHHFYLDDKQFHALHPNMRYHADWCGVPWYYNGVHYKAATKDQQRIVQIVQAEDAGVNYIEYHNYMTGEPLGRQQVPNRDYHASLRLQDSGVGIEVLESGQGPDAVLAEIWNGAWGNRSTLGQLWTFLAKFIVGG